MKGAALQGEVIGRTFQGMAKKLNDVAPRFGIGEWFGKTVTGLTPNERRMFAAESLKEKSSRAPQPCPFQSLREKSTCTKDGGVCSLRLYAHIGDKATGRAKGQPLPGVMGELRATCPYRFHEDLEIFRWVGETILGCSNPKLVGEVGFLESGATTDNEGGDDVGRFDMVLVRDQVDECASLEWCALEIQAVYFSGNAMSLEFRAFAHESVDSMIFPAGRRRPDYRSSGPKRLMPQLQIKVPTLRRWGKKMAVVVDRAFFDSIGEMDRVSDISNADIAWFVVKFEQSEDGRTNRLVRHDVRFTTLERSVEGLTGGRPVPKHVFEARIAGKLGESSTVDAVTKKQISGA